MPTSFRCAGATGQAPTTSFFGAIPDRFNMLYPFHIAFSNAPTLDTTLFAANNVNQWTIYNTLFDAGANANTVSLGALTTAPDGTNTAQHITEASTNSLHFLTAGWKSNSSEFTVRLAVFAKAAERTRIALYVSSEASVLNSRDGGCVTVFDLAGGQIGVANTSYQGAGYGGDPYIAGPAYITPFGNGWYRCMMDVTLPRNNGIGGSTCMRFVLDAGSGTAALNTTYAGNGTSGVYAWRSTTLPRNAWGMSGKMVIYDDFNDPTMAEIDLHNTKAPGFTWYLCQPWPNPEFIGQPLQDASQLSVSGSVLTIASGASEGGFSIMSSVTDGGNGYVLGKTFQFPALFEHRTKCPGVGTDTWFVLWTTSLQKLTNSVQANWIGGESDPYSSSNFVGMGNAAFTNPWPKNQLLCWGYFLGLSIGWVKFEAGNSYDGGSLVYYLGNFYTNSLSTSGVEIPPAAPWSVATPPAGFPSAANIPVYDISQFNIYSTLFLPSTRTDSGCVVYFCNGLMSAYNLFSPRISPGNGSNIFDFISGSTLPVIIGTSPGGPVNIDWVSVSN